MTAHQERKWQRAVRERDDFTCQRCGEYDRYIHTHHIASRSQRPDLKYDVDNGIALCPPCHLFCHARPAEALEAGFRSIERYEYRNGA